MKLVTPPLYIVMILVSFLASLTNVGKKGWPIHLKLFSPFLLATCVVEYYCFMVRESGRPNVYIYNLFSFSEFIFYFYFFYSVFKSKMAKQIALFVIGAYSIAGLVNIFMIQGPDVFHTYSYVLGCSITIIFCVYYFYQLFKFPERGRITRDPEFWINTALLFSFCATLPILGIMNYINSVPPHIIRYLLLILNIMNILLYSLFTFAFICRIIIPKRLSS